MKCAIVGCGYIAEFYAATRGQHPELPWHGVWDHDAARLESSARRWGVRAYASLEQLCADREVELVLNLTNPRSHVAITRQCLEAGKHVYSEKPLGMTAAEALRLGELAASRQVQLASAPSSVLGETAQTLWHAIRRGAIGRVRLVYGNFDDGMIAPNRSPWQWENAAGVPWPARDEFETGCTYEHAGYLLTWLAAFFGPAKSVTAFSSCQIPDKGIAVSTMAPDFAVAAVQYPEGIVARLTFGLVAPRDKSLLIVGDAGSLFVGNVRDEGAPVFLRPSVVRGWRGVVASRLGAVDRFLEARWPWPGAASLLQERYRIPAPAAARASRDKPVDFLRGPSELASAVGEGRRNRLSPSFAAHIVEITERIQYPGRFTTTRVDTTFEAIDPLPWAM